MAALANSKRWASEPTHHAAAVQVLDDANGQVDAFGDEVHRAVHRQQFKLDAQVPGLKLHCRLRQARQRGRQAGGDAQLARGLGPARAGHGLEIGAKVNKGEMKW